MKRSAVVVPAVFAVLAAVVVVLVGPFSPVTRAATALAFEAKFETASDFHDRFDHGVSGFNQLDFGDGMHSFHGDHDGNCGAPTTSRTVNWTRVEHQPEMFWHCAPGGDPARGHLMTGIDTTGYDHLWFAPKDTFERVQQVCFDVNHTSMSHRKWLELQFVDARDAVRHPSAKGSGGFDLGYTTPDFRQDAPNTGIFPQSGNLAGLKFGHGIYKWFQNQSQWTGEAGWPGRDPQAGRPLVTDKAGRYTTCLKNESNGTITITEQQSPGYVAIYGETRTLSIPGQIPQHPVRVVWHDANYDPVKDVRYSPDRITFHWDNVRIFTGTSGSSTTAAPTTAGPTTAPTTAAPTTAAPTTAAPTTAAPTTAAPTTAAPTTTKPTTPPPPAGSAIEWQAKGGGLDGYVGDVYAFRIRATTTVKGAWRLEAALGFVSSAQYGTVAEAKSAANKILTSFVDKSGL